MCQLRKFSNRPNTRGQRMRKSERLRLLEMQIIKLEFEIDLLHNMLATLLQANNLASPELDAGKWYQRRLDKNS